MKTEDINDRLSEAKKVLKKTEIKHQKSEFKIQSVKTRKTIQKRSRENLMKLLSDKRKTSNTLNRFVNENLKGQDVEIGYYSKTGSKLQKEIDYVKLQNNVLRNKNEEKTKKNDELKSGNKQLKDELKLLKKERVKEDTERENKELQQQLDTVLDERKRKGSLTVLTGESQVDNNESLIKLITTHKQQTDSELEELRNDLNLTEKELRMQEVLNFTSSIQELTFDIHDIPSTSTSIKTEFENKNYTG